MIAANHYPILQVIVPLMAAPLCVIVRNNIIVRYVATLASWIALFIATQLMMRVMDDGPIRYVLGGWAAPLGIEYRIDLLNAFLLIIITIIGALVSIYGRFPVEKEIPESRVYLYYTVYLLALSGLLGMTVTGDMFNQFVYLEVAALSSYTLIAIGSSYRINRKALVASFRYLVLGTIGGTFFVIGIGLIYMATGALNLLDMAARIQELGGVADSRTLQVALAFLIVGLGLKMALFPLHLWQPEAYTQSPSSVSVFLAATATKVAVYLMMRVLFTVFGSVDLFATTMFDEALLILAVMAMFVGSLSAIWQVNLKRLLAYSSIAQIGYIILGVSIGNKMALAGSIVHMFNHALIKGALFMAVGAVFYRVGSSTLDDMRGLGKQMPLTMAAFTTAGLSLIGVPLTAGFISKWYLVTGVLQSGHWLVAILILFSSLLAIFYIWKIIEVAYFQSAPADAQPVSDPPLSMLLPMWGLTLLAVYFGIDAETTGLISQMAAEYLLGGGQ
ncbi:MAG: monovalent cation/H+ antiporter subunit D family protein [Magnetococcales bacterium]|nr:monovalent cation/H+ antiporter subunit D family protein [Magnetococcales bacterium]